MLMYKNSPVGVSMTETVEKSGIVYSTEEQVVGTWIDGKPLYRMVVPLLFTSATSRPYKVGEFNVDYDVVVSMQGVSQANIKVPVTSHYNSEYIQIALQGSEIYGYCTNPWANAPAFVIFEYTKTTDPATMELPALLAIRQDEETTNEE